MKKNVTHLNLEYENVMYCPLCGEDSFTTIAREGIIKKNGDLYAVNNVICHSCSLVFINPRPTALSYSKFYHSMYVLERGEVGTKNNAIVFEKNTDQKNISIANALRPFVREGNCTLEIGGGLGTTASYLKEQLGVRAEMIEPSNEQSEYARKQYGLRVYSMDFETFSHSELPKKQYHAIILHHVLEHFIHPTAILTTIATYLHEDGVIYIEVPNVIDFKKPVGQFFDMLHPINFSPATLFWTLHYAGFKPILYNQNKPTRIQIVAVRQTSKLKEIPFQTNTRINLLYTVYYIFYRSVRDTLYRIVHSLH